MVWWYCLHRLRCGALKMYKIINDQIIQKGNTFIPRSEGNMDYQRFKEDVKNNGIDIVEGPDIFEDSYIELREKEYPSWSDQLDKIYHDFDGWKNDIETIKNKYPKSITGGTSIGAVPDWVQTEVDNLNS